MVHLVLDPHRIATTFLKFDLWSPGAWFITIINKINQINENFKKKVKFYAYKKIYYIFYKMGAIPRLPFYNYISI